MKKYEVWDNQEEAPEPGTALHIFESRSPLIAAEEFAEVGGDICFDQDGDTIEVCVRAQGETEIHCFRCELLRRIDVCRIPYVPDSEG